MILYLDTSSLVKMYVDEPGSEVVQRLVHRAEVVSTSVVAYAEARAAFARRRREKVLTAGGHRRVRASFEADWPRLLTLEVAEPLARRAGELAERHRLRGFDALHLASYLTIRDEFDGEEVRFSAAGRALERAARRAGAAPRPQSGRR